MVWRNWFTSNSKPVSNDKENNTAPSQPLGYLLEPRMLFDGAVAATIHETVDATTSSAQSDTSATTDPTHVTTDNNDTSTHSVNQDSTATDMATAITAASGESARKEVAFVDTSVADYRTLEAGIKAGVEIQEFDGSQSGLAQIATWAETHTGYDAIHILSHGMTGTLRTGTDILTDSSLTDTTVVTELAQIGHSLNAGGDILLYGCDIAANSYGQQFVQDFAAATGADVAASTDLTGSPTQGGNWTLEYATGPVETRAALDGVNFDGLLPTSQFNTSTGAIFVRPGSTSYTWTYTTGDGYDGVNWHQNVTLTNIALYNVDFAPTAVNHGEDWVLSRGYFQYSTTGGSSWTTYTVSSSSSDNPIATSGTLWRFVDTTPGDTTTSNNVGVGWHTALSPNYVGSGTSVIPDNAPTDITSNSTNLLSNELSSGNSVATLTPTDTGNTRGGYWAIDSQSVPNLFSVAFDGTVGNTATLKIDSGSMPPVGQQVSVTLHYYDIYQTDSSGNPISGQGVSKTLSFTVAGPSRDISFGDDIHVNTTITDDQLHPATTTLSNGNFVVVWDSPTGIFGQIYDATGVAQGGQIAIDATSTDTMPAVTALANGSFAIAYGYTASTNVN